MFFSTIAARSFGGTGWLALALVASEISSLLQPASSTPARKRNRSDKRANKRTV